MRLALSISLKPSAEAAGAESSAELDGEDVRAAVEAALSRLGQVTVWDTASLSPAAIASKDPPDIIFNMSEGVRGSGREAQAPAMFEWLGWRYTGSDPVALAISLDKWHTRSVLSQAGIPVPDGWLVSSPSQAESIDAAFPAIVKPVAEGSAIGIDRSCVVETRAALVERTITHLERYRQPALVEQFMPGREFTVALIGNSGNWRALPIVEIDFGAIGKAPHPIYGYEAKWEINTPDELSCPAEISTNLRRILEATAVATCEALRLRDLARIDLRLDENGTPNVLDVNPLPGILPQRGLSGFTTAAYAAGLEYDSMIHEVIRVALRRYNR